jgi:5-formyltetrahydrofolate cyclo-ligase
MTSDRDLLRRQFRAQRRRLTPRDRIEATARFAAVAVRNRLLRPRLRIALYMPHGGEADPAALLVAARALRCQIHFPIITNYRDSRMSFVRFECGDVLTCNRYGILEPSRRRTRQIPVRQLDLVLLPLVAVDEYGWRLGSGAGFYDRRFRHLRSGRLWRRPKLVGLAYDFQRIARLAPQPWDVPLDAVLTERDLYPARRIGEDRSNRNDETETRK